MIAREQRWFVRSQGLTLGPLSSAELQASLRSGDIGPSDKINLSGEHSWVKLSDHPELSKFWAEMRGPSIADLQVPSPQILWKKPPLPVVAKKVEAPKPVETVAAVAPVVEAAPIVEPVLETPVKKAAAKEKKPPRAKAPVKVKSRAKPKKAPVVEAIAPPDDAVGRSSVSVVQRVIEKAKPLEAESILVETPAPTPTPAPVRQPEPTPQPTREIRREEIARPIIEAIAVFPERPAVPEERWEPKESRSPRRNPEKYWRAAALTMAALLIAGVAYLAGQKTRDLKELPLSDPSSPTTQLPAASDPIQPLRAPTRPQRD